MSPKNGSIRCVDPCFVSAQKRRRTFWSILCHTLECGRVGIEMLWIIWSQQWEAAHVILETFLLTKPNKQNHVSGIITALTGIKTICSVCFPSHQPLLTSVHQEVKSTKMFISLWPIQQKHLKTFTLSMQRGSRVETIERDTQIWPQLVLLKVCLD